MQFGGDSIAERLDKLAASPYVISTQAENGLSRDDEMTAIVAPIRALHDGHD